MKNGFIAALAVLILSGCQALQPQPVVERKVAFPVQEYEALEMEGSSTVKGQFFMTTRGGEVKYGAGRDIALTPVTSYTTEATQVAMSGRAIAPADPRAQAYTKKSIADGSGNFEFNNLPAGKYYVAGEMFWEVPTGGYGLSRQGGLIIRMVTVEEGETATLMLNR